MDSKIENLCLEVEGLFNLYDYALVASIDKPLILTGPNGYGKTTLLTILKKLKAGNVIYFLSLPFRKITVSVNGERMLTVESSVSQGDNEDDNEEDAERIIDFIAGEAPTDRLRLSVNELTYALRRHRWGDLMEITDNPDEFSSYDTFVRLERHNDELLRSIIHRQKSNISLAFASLPDISFVQADRLRSSMPDIDDTTEPARVPKKEEIVKISKHLKSILEPAYQQYLAYSQKSDKEFVRNILTQSEPISKEEYEKGALKLERCYGELSEYGLADEIKLPEYCEDKSFVLKCYLKDLHNNYLRYDKILEKLTLFSGLVNNKRLAGKRMVVDRTTGIRMISEADDSFIEKCVPKHLRTAYSKSEFESTTLYSELQAYLTNFRSNSGIA